MKNLHLFDPVLAWLDDYDPTRLGFHMGYIRISNGEDVFKNHCGTVCCIAGALCELNKIPVGPQDYETDVAAELLGLTEEQVDALFFARAELCGDLHPSSELENITPAEAARTIRHFIATGEVVWD